MIPVKAGIKCEGTTATLTLALGTRTIIEDHERSKQYSLADFLIRWRIWSLDAPGIGREQRAIAIFAWRHTVKTFEITNEVTLVS